MYDVQLPTSEEQTYSLDQQSLTRIDVAKRLLELTALNSLRKEVRNKREWMGIYRGYRADSLTRAQLVRGAASFASQSARLGELCQLFLTDLGVEKDGDLHGRFRAAAESPQVADETRALCQQLASFDLDKLPQHHHGQADMPETSQPPEGEAAGNIGSPPETPTVNQSKAPRKSKARS